MSPWSFFFRFVISRRAGSLIRRISWISFIGVTISFASFIVVMSVMIGLNQNIHKRILRIEPHMVFHLPHVKTESELIRHPSYYALKSREELDMHIFEKQDVIIRTVDGFFRGAEARGVDGRTLNYILTEFFGELTDGDVPGKGEIVLGADLAKILGVFEGDYVLIIPPETLLIPEDQIPTFEKVKVQKIVRSNVSEIDTNLLYYNRGMTLESFRNSLSRQLGLEIWSQDPFDLDKYKKLVPEGLETWQDRNSVLFHALKIEKTVIGIFLSMSALTAGLSILTVLMLLISQKKKDSAILLTLGLSKMSLRKLFVKIGCILGGIGMSVGAIIGTLVALYIEKYPLKVLPDIYYDSDIPAKVEFPFIILVICIGGFLIFLGAFYTARVIDQLNPTLALKEKAG